MKTVSFYKFTLIGGSVAMETNKVVKLAMIVQYISYITYCSKDLVTFRQRSLL